MDNKDIIKSGLVSFSTLLGLLSKKIDFENREPYEFKSIIEGRKTSFDVAQETLTYVKQLQEGENLYVEKDYRANLQRLVDSTEDLMKEINKVLIMSIDVDDSGDDKIKLIAQSKSLSISLLMNISSIRDSIKYQLKNEQSLSGNTNRNFATDMVKG